MTELDVRKIQELLPHRYPFLMLDKVIEVVPDEKIVAVKNVSIDEPFFPGHFPQKPVMPGVLIVEAMAQASAILGLLSATAKEHQGKLYYLVGIDKARFRKIVEPGDQLVIEARYITVKRNIWRFSCRAEVDGKLVADAELLTTVADPDS